MNKEVRTWLLGSYSFHYVPDTLYCWDVFCDSFKAPTENTHRRNRDDRESKPTLGAKEMDRDGWRGSFSIFLVFIQSERNDANIYIPNMVTTQRLNRDGILKILEHS